MAVVGEMHVGKGKEEKGKGKPTRSHEGVASRAQRAACTPRARDMRLSHSRCARLSQNAPVAFCVRHARPRVREMRMPRAKCVCQPVRNSRALGAVSWCMSH